MKQYGYDAESGALFSWDSDFHFEGVHANAPDGAFVSTGRQLDAMIGCAFLSGWRGPYIVLHSDGIEERLELLSFNDRVGMICLSLTKEILIKMTSRMPICVCGKIVSLPDKMAEMCDRFPSSRMYVCPIVDELSAFGVLVRNIHQEPCRNPMVRDNRAPIDAESIDYDSALNGDAMGRMADVVAKGMPAVNETMTTVGISPFHGKTLFREGRGGTALVRSVEMDELFPAVPISAKNYAATSVPVRMKNTQQFSDKTGYNGKFIDVFVATDNMPGVCDFLVFLKTMAGQGIAFSAEQIRVRHGAMVPVFRGDKAYRVPREKYEQARGFLYDEQGSVRR